MCNIFIIFIKIDQNSFKCALLAGKKKKRITPGQKLQDLIKKIGITNPKVVDLTSSQVTAENLVEYKIFCKFEEKDYYLYQFLRTHKGRTIVFCNSIGCVKRLANLLTILNRKYDQILIRFSRLL